MFPPKLKPYAYMAGAILLWSTQAMVTKLGVAELGPASYAFYAFAFTFIGSAAVMLIKGRARFLKTYKFHDSLPIATMGAAWGIGSFLYYISFQTVPASEAITLRYTWPLMLSLSGFFVLKEKMSLRSILAVLFGFIAVYGIVAQGNLVVPSFTNLVADGFILISAFLWVYFLTIEKKFGYEAYSSTTLMNFVSVLIIGAIALPGGLVLPSLSAFLATAYFGLITGAIGTILYIKALQSEDTAVISNLSFLTPFAALGWNFMILGEELHWYYLAALTLIVAGFFLSKAQAKSKATVKHGAEIYDVTRAFTGTSRVDLYVRMREDRIHALRVPAAMVGALKEMGLRQTEAKFATFAPAQLAMDIGDDEVEAVYSQLGLTDGDAVVFAAGEEEFNLAMLDEVARRLKK